MAGLIRPDDLMLVNRASTNFQTEVKNIWRQPISDHELLPTPPWHGAAGIYHVIVADPNGIRVTNHSNIYNLDTEIEASSINAPGEWIITGPNTQFKNSTGNWEFGDLTNTRDVTNMRQMFFNAVAFNSDISDWKVGNVTNMGMMFQKAGAFNSDISNWDVSNVTNMRSTFYYSNVFNVDVSGWDVSNVTDMGYMFYQAQVFNQNLTSWCVNPEPVHNDFQTESQMPQDGSNDPKWGTCP